MLVDFALIRGILLHIGPVGLNGGDQVTQPGCLAEHSITELLEGLQLLNVYWGRRKMGFRRVNLGKLGVLSCILSKKPRPVLELR